MDKVCSEIYSRKKKKQIFLYDYQAQMLTKQAYKIERNDN